MAYLAYLIDDFPRLWALHTKGLLRIAPVLQLFSLSAYRRYVCNIEPVYSKLKALKAGM